jgi:hypothetical protein
MANIQIFEINEDGELLVNDPALAGALQELTPEELRITGGLALYSGNNCVNTGICVSAKPIAGVIVSTSTGVRKA